MSTLYLLPGSIGGKLAAEILPSVDSSLHYLSKTKKAKAKFHFKKIHPNQVYRLLDKLKTGKASRMDLMANKFLKIAKNILAKFFSDIFNASIESKIVPQDFKLIAKVTPVFKGGLTDDLSKYGPISVLSIIAHIFEKLLYSHLSEFLTENDILDNKQWGSIQIASFQTIGLLTLIVEALCQQYYLLLKRHLIQLFMRYYSRNYNITV